MYSCYRIEVVFILLHIFSFVIKSYLYFEYKNLRKKEKINIYMIQTCLQCIYKINLIDIKFKYTGKYSYILNA
ncbi:hypothetical protein PFNF135_04480 [Plasmodium falciparum NF135/5.C10]|nr:hypothetical protein PFNF135_04480 [Plasmodium falciparum NF135/5.C10]